MTVARSLRVYSCVTEALAADVDRPSAVLRQPQGHSLAGMLVGETKAERKRGEEAWAVQRTRRKSRQGVFRCGRLRARPRRKCGNEAPTPEKTGVGPQNLTVGSICR